jgi:aminoglycoside phosphotransferase (APT) family kinase protein
MPVADIPIDDALVERLVQNQHPDLAGPLALVANGWDNAIYRLGEQLCVRLPRRRVAASLIPNEQRWLPAIAALLGVPTPVPVRVGVPDNDYPWPWTICPWFEGRPATKVPPSSRGSIATDLATFMANLHVPAPAEAPRNPVRGVPLGDRTAAVEQYLASGLISRASELSQLWEKLVAVSPWTGRPVWLHGDPHPANILLEHGTDRLVAIIDFGDVTSGDPATDLAAAWLVFDAPARQMFRSQVDGLTQTDEDTWSRARGWALAIGAALAASSDDNPRLAETGRHVLDQVLMSD